MSNNLARMKKHKECFGQFNVCSRWQSELTNYKCMKFRKVSSFFMTSYTGWFGFWKNGLCLEVLWAMETAFQRHRKKWIAWKSIGFSSHIGGIIDECMSLMKFMQHSWKQLLAPPWKTIGSSVVTKIVALMKGDISDGLVIVMSWNWQWL